MEQIKNNIKKTILITWRELEWLQPKNFKKDDPKRIQKLKNSLVKNGFLSPFHIWQSKSKLYILDGHIREKAMRELESEGVDIPDKLPASFINCKNKDEAKERVLVYNSRYAEIDNEVAIDWFPNLKEFENEIDIPEIDFDFESSGDIVENGIDIDEEFINKYKSENIKIYDKIVIIFSSENGKNEFIEKFGLEDKMLYDWNEIKPDRN